MPGDGKALPEADDVAKGPAAQAVSSVGRALLDEVVAVVRLLQGLLQHASLLGETSTAAIRSAVDDVTRRLSRKGLCVVVCGEKKAGKSTFLNALLGERVLGAAVREYTGAITVIQHGPVPNYRAHFMNGSVEEFAQIVPQPRLDHTQQPQPSDDRVTRLQQQLAGVEQRLHTARQAHAFWQTTMERARQQGMQLLPSQLTAFGSVADQLRQLETQSAQIKGQLNGVHNADPAQPLDPIKHRFLNDVRRLTDMQSRGAEVSYLRLIYPGRFLPRGLTIIDTPGVNTDNEANRRRAWSVIRKEADGCILLSDLQQAVSQTTKDFVRQVREIVPHIILVLTKVDRALANAEGGQGDPQEQIDEARRLGLRRFAKEVGRDPNEVLAFAISAERSLAQDSQEWVERFQSDILHLLETLRRERVLIIGTRAALTIQRCLVSIADAQGRAESAYRQRIAALEAQRIPDPARFHL